MKKILLGFLLLLSACTPLKARDVDYRTNGAGVVAASALVEQNGWANAVFAVKKAKDSDWAFGSCVGIGYSPTKDETYLATAFHIIQGNVKYIEQTEGNRQILPILRVYSHPRKDIGFLVVKGKLPTVTVNRGVPISDYDITLGYIGGDLTKKGVLVGQAVPGQSGGGVFSNKMGLFGVVSTTGEAVAIWPALVELKLEYEYIN